MLALYHKPYDQGGLVAASGTIHDSVVEYLLLHEFFQVTPPKSTGREQFGRQYTKQLLEQFKHISPQDLIASITFATAKTIVDAYKNYILPQYDLQTIVVSGGGMHNQTLRKHLESGLPGITITTSDEYGIDSDYKEAIAFAILGHQTFHHRPSNVPSATGASKAVVLGQISYPNQGGYQ
jgi:anhydro-N-acetylmuramic acid kinase